MFDPKDFLKVSENIFKIVSGDSTCKDELVDNSYEEAFHRIIVSRAYYAVYLSCSDFLRKNFGIDVYAEAKKRKESVHALLPQIIGKKLNKRYLMDFINDLRYKRINSDYDLDSPINENDSEYCIKLAKDILEDLGLI